MAANLTSDDRKELLDALLQRLHTDEISSIEFRRECYKISIPALDVDDYIREHSRGRVKGNAGGQSERLPFASGLPFRDKD